MIAEIQYNKVPLPVTQELWECELVQPLWKMGWNCLKKLNTEPSYDLAIPLLGIYPKEMKTLTQKDICTPMVTAALVTIAKIWKCPMCSSVDEWIKQMWYTRVQGTIIQL